METSDQSVLVIFHLFREPQSQEPSILSLMGTTYNYNVLIIQPPDNNNQHLKGKKRFWYDGEMRLRSEFLILLSTEDGNSLIQHRAALKQRLVRKIWLRVDGEMVSHFT